MAIRNVKRLAKSKPTLEGAGVHLRRAFGFGSTSDTDPFLLLDDFRNERPEDYLPGFPWHPHRGIETITYVLAGTVAHGDSMGNHGTIGAGDVQWMTAGRGIIHQEMPKGDSDGRMHGFQLWANLPSSLKMTEPPLAVLIRMHDRAAHDGIDGPTGEGIAVKRRVAAEGMQLIAVKRPHKPGVNDGQIGSRADAQPGAAHSPELQPGCR